MNAKVQEVKAETNQASSGDYKTPTQKMGINVKPRQPKWTFNNVPVAWGGSPEKTALLAALSLVAPVFEPWACRVVRDHLDLITEPELKKEARAFIGQESHHWKVHQRFNDQVLVAHGWDVDEIQGDYFCAVGEIDRKHDARQLLATVAAGEHFLYFISMYLLDGDSMEDVHKMPQLMFEWHALEEVEHTSIAFDVYQHVYGESPKNYFGRLGAMNRMLSFLPSVLGTGYKKSLREYDKVMMKSGKKNALKASKFGGWHLGTKAIFDVARFYKPGFHPWKTHDKTHYLKRMPAIVETFDLAG